MKESVQPLPPARPRFKPYPAYKDSGVEWLGEIPAHWEVKRLKHLATLNPESLMEDTDPGREMVYVDIGGVNSLGRIVEQEQLAFSSAPSRARRLVRDGDVVVSTVRTYLRAIAPIRNPEPGMVVSTGFAVVRPVDDLTTDYAAYALRAPYFVERVVANSKGVSFPAINESEMATYELASPPIPEQRAIAAFLDRETARIDALVAKKERLIALLQEQRTALITRAVTNGLDPCVPTKDSGVEWLGEIPAHWEVKPLKREVRFLEGPGIMASDFTNDGIPLLRIAGIGGRRASLSGCNYLSPDLVHRRWDHFCVRIGDLLISGSASTGFCSEVDVETQGAVPYTGIIIMRPRAGTMVRTFLRWFLLSGAFLTQTELARCGSAIQHFGPSHLSRMHMMVPPHSEQVAIAVVLDRETARIDALVAKVRDAIDRLQELRAALISAAVTGRIDVRKEVA
ncbi:MAG: restriction endonuclease subunit S [Candidatus Eisenbacteria bacterium]|nr:restriction endonuclease subunit S [Candidatus Eisenbacteria bacterium]